MPYDEVRSALLISKMLANEAVKYTHTLNIMKVHQMDGPAARRFLNVEEVNCMCLLSFNEVTEDTLICAKTATRVVPFLVTIPNLKRVFVGGWYNKWSKRTMTRIFFELDDFLEEGQAEKETTIFGCLVRAFLGALQGRLFPHLERISGVTEALDSSCLCERTEKLCSFCRDVCTYFPVKDLLENADLEGFGDCEVENAELYEIIAKRPLSKVAIRASSENHLCQFVYTRLRDCYIAKHEIKGKQLLAKLLSQNRLCDVDGRDLRVNHLDKMGISTLDKMIALGFDPRAIPKDRLYLRLRIEIGESWEHADVFAKSTVDALIARGFNLDPKDLIILDEETEPVLKKKLPGLIRKED